MTYYRRMSLTYTENKTGNLKEMKAKQTTLDSELDQPGVALVSSTSLQLSGAITQYPGRGCTYQYRYAVRMEAVPIKLV